MPAINGSAGWVPGSWSRRSNSAGSKDTNKFPTFSENWKPSFHLGRRLSNGERRRKVGYARAATFNGKSGDPVASAIRKRIHDIEPDQPVAEMKTMQTLVVDSAAEV